MLTGLPSSFYYQKQDNLERFHKTLFCANQFSIREVMMI